LVFPAGGSTDITARLISQSLSERLRQQFFVENRPGAAGSIGTEAVVRAPGDGYTLLMAADPNAINATVYEHLNFNFIRDYRLVVHCLQHENGLASLTCAPTSIEFSSQP
jgi:tripartite-type tricarboxylate transporter receptor subunit TctC